MCFDKFYWLASHKYRDFGFVTIVCCISSDVEFLVILQCHSYRFLQILPETLEEPGRSLFQGFVARVRFASAFSLCFVHCSLSEDVPFFWGYFWRFP